MKTLLRSFFVIASLVASTVLAENQALIEPPPSPPDPSALLLVHALDYRGALSDTEAKFTVNLDLELTGGKEATVPLFDGELAVLPTKLPDHLRLARVGNVYTLTCTKLGRHKLSLDLVAKIIRKEPWNHVAFSGPQSAIGSVIVEAAGANTELQLLTGTVLETDQQPDRFKVRAFLGPDRAVSVRWQSRAAEVTRTALLTCNTSATIHMTPTIIKYNTQFQYDIVQGTAPKLTVSLPLTQALTRVQGDQIRDWRLEAVGDTQVLTVEFIKPAEKTCRLTLLTEQPVTLTGDTVVIAPPQPLDVERESGSLTVSAEDVLVETNTMTGLRQVNAPQGALASYQFFGRPFVLTQRIRRIEPVVTVADRVAVRLEESRLTITHRLKFHVDKAGIYHVELTPQPGFLVADVTGEGIEDWNVRDGKIHIAFASRVMGPRAIQAQLEQALKEVPETITVLPLRVADAAKQSVQIGVAVAAGIQLKTAPDQRTGLRELAMQQLTERTDETLAFASEQGDWRLVASASRQNARVTAEIFNLVTIGDGLVGASATIRYAIVNQGVQELRVHVPSFWKNVDFTGPMIRRKEEAKDATGSVWTITLQEKAWGGYTLVITYDGQFDPQQATLPIAGVHALNAERETGSIAITSTANQQLTVAKDGDPLRRIDEFELAAADRSLIARPVLIAYRYAGAAYQLSVDVKRFAEAAGLQAVADRTQLTTVLTKEGDMMTQASFMVKNNDKQFQRITLPGNADLWSCFVNNQAVKPERDGSAVLVPLPRGLNRDQAFAVDIVYAQKRGPLAPVKPATLVLQAPRTDMQTTYAEWEFYAPQEYRLLGFGGNMFAARGTTYTLRDAWRKFLAFYSNILSGPVLGLAFLGGLAALLIISIVIGIRRGFRGLISWAIGLVVLALLAGMLLPATESARRLVRATAQPTAVGDSGAVTLDQQSADQHSHGIVVWSAGPNREPPPPSASIPQQAGPGLITPSASGAGMAAGGTMLPVVSGIRPIRIDIPRQGNRYVFTKVLNVRNAAGEVGGELLRIEATAVKNTLFKTVRCAAQMVAFLAGLALLLWQFRWVDAARRSSLMVTIGLSLTVGAVVSLLVATRSLHVLFVGAPPVVGLLLFVWIVARLWNSLAGKSPVENGRHRADTTDTPPGVPPAVAGLMALLFAASAAQAAPEDAPVPITSATYTGSVSDRAGQFVAVIELNATSDNQQVRLFGEEVAVQEFAGVQEKTGGWWGWGRKTAESKLVRDGKFVNVLLPAKGPATVRLKFLVKVKGDVAKRQVAFAIPPAVSSQLNVVIEEPEAAVEFPTAVSFQTKTEGQQTRVQGVIGSETRVDLTWTPRVKRAAEIAATVFCQNNALVNIGSGLINVRAVLDYQVMQGEFRQMRVRLPSDQRLMRVEGDLIRTWKVADDQGASVLTVELLKGVSTAYRLTVETEKMTGTSASIVTNVEIPHALDVKRETGLIALKPSEELAVTVDKAEGLQKVDAEEFARVWVAPSHAPDTRSVKVAPAPSPVLGIAGAYRFLSADAPLQIRIESMQPEIEAVVNNAVRLTTEQAALTSTVNYTIKRAGVFVLRLGLPADYRVESVQGDTISQWVEKTENNRSVLEVTLKNRTTGAYALRLRLVRHWRTPPATLTVEGAHPIGTQKLSGSISICSEEGLELKSTTVTGLTEVPATSAIADAPGGASGSALAYRFIATEPTPEPGWTLAVETEQLESWVRAEVVNWLTLTESLLTGRSVVRFDIQNAPVKELRLRIPEHLKNVDITGANIRRSDHEGSEWRIELQTKVRGSCLLTVTWDMPARIDIEEKDLALVGVGALGVERETGVLAVIAQPPLKIEDKTVAGGVSKIDPRETPEWAGTSSTVPTLAYRYLRPGYELVLGARRFEEAAVLQAIIDSVRLTTAVAEDGQMMTEMVLAIRNNARQYLAVALPANSEVWSAFVAGQPVRPSLREGKVLVPLERSGSDGAPISVELVYASVMPFPPRSGTVQMQSPHMDLPLKNARWDLYLPPDYRYGDFKGSMTRQTHGEPTVESYSYIAYQQAEQEHKQVRADNVRMNVGQLKSSLDTGKLKEASEYYNRAKRQALAHVWDETANKELQQLEQRWQRDQAGNLVQQQRQIYEKNAPAVPAQTGQQADFAYDIRSAEEQVYKLQKAQELAETKVTPLRVNLPRRGLRYSFTQALQTETEKSLHVSFDARNTRASTWPVRIATGAAGFLLLWVLMAVVMRRK